MHGTQSTGTGGDPVIDGYHLSPRLDEQAHVHLGLVGIQTAVAHHVIHNLGVVGRAQRGGALEQTGDVAGRRLVA